MAKFAHNPIHQYACNGNNGKSSLTAVGLASYADVLRRSSRNLPLPRTFASTSSHFHSGKLANHGTFAIFLKRNFDLKFISGLNMADIGSIFDLVFVFGS